MRGDGSNGRTSPKAAAVKRPRICTTVRLSSGISANILDFAHSAKAETGLKDRRGRGRRRQTTWERPKIGPAGPTRQAGARNRAGSDSEKARAGAEKMSLKFEIQPAANPTSEKERAARLVDPGFGRIFTDHMAVVRYNQAKGWHGARVEIPRQFPARSGRRRAALRAGDFRRPQGLQARRRRREPVPPRRQCPALPEFGRAHGDGAGARARVHRSGRAARAHRPRLDPGRRGQSLSAALHDRERGLPRREAFGGIHLRRHRLAGRLLFQGRTCAGVDLGVGELHARRDRRHRRRQMRRQLRRQPARAGRGHRSRLRSGGFPRCGRAPLHRGTRRHEHLLRVRRRLAADAAARHHPAGHHPRFDHRARRRIPARACARRPTRSTSGAPMPPAAS